ncbi:MAG: hypothetical protein CMP98_09955 [Gammaproteobacteria bacterium]|nr:hypothetical protein [Gammaproteobacteria bacterium]OUU08323.1 MAG: hypothetical protein CBB94_10185 [Gammaproteobacteria bacterium TMED34]
MGIQTITASVIYLPLRRNVFLIDKAYVFQTFRVCQRMVISISVEFLEQSARHPQIEAPFM